MLQFNLQNLTKETLIMGLEGFRLGSILLVLLIVLLLFGTKRIRDIGEDLGKAVRGFRKGFSDSENTSESETKD